MNREARIQARALRVQGKALGEIARTLKVAKSSVSIWVRDIVLTPDQIVQLKAQHPRYGAQNKGAQVNKEQARMKRARWQQQGRDRARSNPTTLHMSGCLLYWAEGAKHRNFIHFINSDADMLIQFMRFLQNELAVPSSDIFIYIHCHIQPEENIKRIQQYWLTLFGLPLTALKHTYVKPGSESRHNKLENGICTLRVHNTALVQHIYGAIQEYMQIDKPEWLG